MSLHCWLVGTADQGVLRDTGSRREAEAWAEGMYGPALSHHHKDWGLHRYVHRRPDPGTGLLREMSIERLKDSEKHLLHEVYVGRPEDIAKEILLEVYIGHPMRLSRVGFNTLARPVYPYPDQPYLKYRKEIPDLSWGSPHRHPRDRSHLRWWRLQSH